MRRLIWAFAVRKCPKTRFDMARPFLLDVPIFVCSPTTLYAPGVEHIFNLASFLYFAYKFSNPLVFVSL